MFLLLPLATMMSGEALLPPVVVPPRVAAGTAPSVRVQLVYQATINGESAKKRCPQVNWDAVRQKVEKELQARCAKRVTASGLFSRIDSGAQASADISVNICVDGAEDFNEVMAFLTGFTLFILPCNSKNAWQMTATVKNNVTGKTAEFQLTDGTTTWIELLLIVGMPFKFPACTTTHVRNACSTTSLSTCRPLAAST